MAEVNLKLHGNGSVYTQGALVKAKDGDVVGVVVLHDTLYNVLVVQWGQYGDETYYELELIYPEPTDLIDLEDEFEVFIESGLVKINVERGN